MSSVMSGHKTMPLLTISVVIATYNRPDSLGNCLESLERQESPPHEVIVVVDSALTDAIQKVIDSVKKRKKLNIVLLSNGQNRGAPYSKNRGAAAATGDIVAFVDDDITIIPDWTVQIRKGYDRHPDAAGVGGQVDMQQFIFDNPLYRLSVRVRQFLFGSKLGRFNFLGLPYISLTKPSKDGRCIIVDFLHGGNMTFRRNIIVSHELDPTLGGRDEFDLCVRLTLREKRKLIYNPGAIAYHHHTPVGGLALWGTERLYKDFEDHIPYLMKNFSWKYTRLAAFSVMVCAYSLLTLKPRFVKALATGYRRYRNYQTAGKTSVATRETI